VVVTGAAGGIGTATCAAFLKRGFLVAGVDRYTHAEAMDSGIMTDLPNYKDSPEYTHYTMGIRNYEEIRETFLIVGERGSVNHVVSIAGGGAPGEAGLKDLAEIPASIVEESIQVNLTAQIILAGIALPYLRKTGAGATLAFTSSINAYRGIGMYAYSAAKNGLISLVQNIAAYEGQYGIRVNAVAPGTVITPRTTLQWEGHPDHFEKLTETAALSSLATTEDIASMFVALVLDMQSVTGQTITVDAGQTSKWR
jgi:NAD(P)-dependent dehydrogenase (short-subunit alcohol dehydrogenase family)